jgi:hypothetical protein
VEAQAPRVNTHHNAERAPVALILTRKASHVVHRRIGALAKRWTVHPKTPDRWAREGVRVGDGEERVHLPPPDFVVNSVRFWKDETAAAFDEVVEILTRGEKLPSHLAKLAEEWRRRALEKRESKAAASENAGGGFGFSAARPGPGKGAYTAQGLEGSNPSAPTTTKGGG